MNDERPIEKLLRRYAKKRCEDAGAPLEMHPATRRLLQGEVARQFRKAGGEKTSAAGWLAALQRRWVYATAAASAVVIAATLLVMNNNQPGVRDLAKQEAAPTKAPARKPTGELAKDFDSRSPGAPAPALNGRVLEEAGTAPALATVEKQKSVDEFKNTTPVPPTVATDGKATFTAESRVGETLARAAGGSVGSLTVAGKLNEVAHLRDKAEADAKAGVDRLASAPAATAARVDAELRYQAAVPSATPAQRPSANSPAGAAAKRDAKVATATPAAAPAVSARAFSESAGFAPIARGGGVAGERQAARSQSFANLLPKTRAESDRAAVTREPVLLNFQVEQAGNQVRVVDADGSTYLGEMTVEPVAAGEDFTKGALALKKQIGVAAKKSAEQTTRNVFYRVAGTNRTLNQQVVFTWSFLAPTNALAQSQTQVVSEYLNNQPVNRIQQLPGLYNNSGLTGRAQINSTKEIEIRAQPMNQ